MAGSKAGPGRPAREAKLSRTHAPANLSPVDWQRALRRQFGRDQAFTIQNSGSEPFFSDSRIGNPQSKTGYRVAIRGRQPGENYCSCPDYATNELGTCKHIESLLSRLEAKRGAKAAFERGWQPAFSEIYLRNDGTRTVHFRAGSDCPPAVHKAAGLIFDAGQGERLPEERFGELERFLAAVAKSGHELRAYDDTLDFVAGRRDARRRVEVLESQFPKAAGDARLTKLLKVPLYPYQAEGALFAVRAFKRSLSVGILDAGSGEIPLGGFRLNRFKKDVENLTGRLGEGEAVTLAEEAGAAGTLPVEQPVPAEGATGSAHPWIERDPTTGERSLKLTLPPPHTVQRLADALGAIADSLRSSGR